MRRVRSVAYDEKNDSEYEAVRELVVSLKRQGVSLCDVASHSRLLDYIKKLGADEEQIEAYIRNCVNSTQPEKLMEVANQVLEVSMSVLLHSPKML